MKRGANKGVRNILFVCRYNRFRSRVAAAYFRKVNKNKKIKSGSAGLIKGDPVNPLAAKTAREFGLNIKGKTRGLSSGLLEKQDAVVIVADDVPPQTIKNKCKKLIVLKVKDTKVINAKVFRKIIKEIIKKIDKLNRELKIDEH